MGATRGSEITRGSGLEAVGLLCDTWCYVSGCEGCDEAVLEGLRSVPVFAYHWILLSQTFIKILMSVQI